MHHATPLLILTVSNKENIEGKIRIKTIYLFFPNILTTSSSSFSNYHTNLNNSPSCPKTNTLTSQNAPLPRPSSTPPPIPHLLRHRRRHRRLRPCSDWNARSLITTIVDLGGSTISKWRRGSCNGIRKGRRHLLGIDLLGGVVG